jgi:predicted metal-dependent peptidase
MRSSIITFAHVDTHCLMAGCICHGYAMSIALNMCTTKLERTRRRRQRARARAAKAKGEGEGKPNAGGFDGTGDIEDALDEATCLDMEATIGAAASMAKACGHGSSLIDRVLGELGQSHVSWQDETRAMLTESCRADYTYRRFSRRFLSSNLYMPSLHSDALGGLAIGFDTSGSMGQKECDQIAAELQEIIADLNPEFVEVVYCDYTVSTTQRFERDDPLILKPTGGGGTRFKPVFEHIEQSGQRYCGLIYFTDMEGNLEECDEPEYPVIWADIGTRHPTAPFGSHMRVPL